MAQKQLTPEQEAEVRERVAKILLERRAATERALNYIIPVFLWLLRHVGGAVALHLNEIEAIRASKATFTIMPPDERGKVLIREVYDAELTKEQRARRDNAAKNQDGFWYGGIDLEQRD